jgi:hypothetical protein
MRTRGTLGIFHMASMSPGNLKIPKSFSFENMTNYFKVVIEVNFIVGT